VLRNNPWPNQVDMNFCHFIYLNNQSLAVDNIVE
jgi:hypothetical protein